MTTTGTLSAADALAGYDLDASRHSDGQASPGAACQLADAVRRELAARAVHGPVTGNTARELPAILADLDRCPSGTEARELYHELEDTLRARLTPHPDAAALAAQAERAAKTAAPPVPGITDNGGMTVFAVLPGDRPAGWYVACERGDGETVTWIAYANGEGTLVYSAGNYFTSRSSRANRRDALIDLAERAGVLRAMSEQAADPAVVADAMESYGKALERLTVFEDISTLRTRQALLHAALTGLAEVTRKAGPYRAAATFTVIFDRYRRVFRVREER